MTRDERFAADCRRIDESEKTARFFHRVSTVLTVASIVLILAMLFCLAGCMTVTPPVTPAAQTPVGNGGIISGAAGGPFRLTGEQHSRYNSLVAIWGTKGGFLPPLVPNAGISAISPQDGSCLIDGEHMVDLILMQAYQDGRAKP